MLTSWTIGSGPDCDIRVAQPKVSGRHCRLAHDGQGYTLEDLGSTNGTYVNGERVVGPVVVTRNDAITLGLTTPLPWPADDSADRVVRLRIGHAPENDFVVAEPLVAAYHAQVCWERASGRFFLEDLGSGGGTALGSPDRQVVRSALGVGDTVYLGSYPVAAIQLLARLDPGLVPTLPLRQAEVVIGRAAGSDLILDLPMISGRHARVFRAGDSIRIEDLGSANGTFLNGRRIDGPTIVRAGDLVGLGSYTVRLAVDRSPAPVAAGVGAPISTAATAVPASAGPDRGTSPARIPGVGWGEVAGHPGLLLGLVGQAPVVALAIVALAGGGRGATGSAGGLAPALGGLSVAAVWFGLSSGALPGLLDPRRGVRPGGVAVAAVVAAVQAVLAWGIVAGLMGLGGPGVPAAVLVALGSVVGVALGVLLAGGATSRSRLGLAGLTIMAAVWLFGGGPGTLPRVAAWARPVAQLVPSRWVFEGLLLLEAEARPGGMAAGEASAEPTPRGVAEAYFPARTDRMGPTADFWAIGLMLVGLWATIAYLTWAAGPAVKTAPGAPRGAPAG